MAQQAEAGLGRALTSTLLFWNVNPQTIRRFEMKIWIEVTTTNGDVVVSESQEATEDQVESAGEAIKSIKKLSYFSIEVSGGTVYFNIDQIVSIKICKGS